MQGFETAATFIIAIALGAVLIVLATGVFNMFRKGHDARRSNQLMRWRVILQAVAIGLILVFLWLTKH